VLVRHGLIRALAAHAPMLRRLSERFIRFGSDVGGMTVELTGTDRSGAPLHLRWSLSADAGDSPQVPVTPVAVLAQQWADGNITETGARACMGLLTLDQLVSGFVGYAVGCGVDTLR
jgi:hypothetical protein